MKKGFTLTELLAVIVLLALISFVGYTGISSAKNNIRKNIWEGTINSIEYGAKLWGEDNKIKLRGVCTNVPKRNDDYEIEGTESKNDCVKITVNQLIEYGYVKTNNEHKCSNTKSIKIVVNSTVDEEDTNYIVNNRFVYVYKRNDIVYAILSDEVDSSFNIC